MNRANYRQREKIRARLKAIGEPCAICGKPIDYDLDWWIDPKDGKRKRHPLSFEYDHITPHANGGDNTFSNAQPAHRICNQRKSNKDGHVVGVPISKRDKKFYANGQRVETPKQLPNSRAW